MYDEDVLSERVAFRLTPEERFKLSTWAREEHRTLANLIYALICRAIAEEEHRRGQPFQRTQTERESL